MAAVLAISFALGSCADAAKLRPVQDLPEDVAALVEETWLRFEMALPLVADCMDPVSLVLVEQVEGGDAVYRAADRIIEVEIPTSPARFPESLVHELGHHVATTCAEQQSIRAAFLAAQGFLPDADWSSGGEWAAVPAEHFAETVVAAVLGDRILHEDVIDLSPAAIALVGVWGGG